VVFSQIDSGSVVGSGGRFDRNLVPPRTTAE
jgi:hypothetical protein